MEFALTAYLVGWATVVIVTYVLSVPKLVTPPGLLLGLSLSALASLSAWHLAGRPSPPSFAAAARSLRGLGARTDVRRSVLAATTALTYTAFLALVTRRERRRCPRLRAHSRRTLAPELRDRRARHRLRRSARHQSTEREILQLATMVLTGGDRFVALGQWTAVPALMAGTYGVSRRLGLSARGAAFGALLVPSLPVVLVQSWSALTDVVFASFLVAAVFFALGRRQRELIPLGLAIALAVGTKFLGPLYLPLVGLTIVVAQPARRRTGFLVAFALGGLIGGVWYVFNAVNTGAFLGRLDPPGSRTVGSTASSCRFRSTCSSSSTSRAPRDEMSSLPHGRRVAGGHRSHLAARATLRRNIPRPSGAFAACLVAFATLTGLALVSLFREGCGDVPVGRTWRPTSARGAYDGAPTASCRGSAWPGAALALAAPPLRAHGVATP